MLKLLGALAGYCFCASGFPVALSVWKNGHAVGIPVMSAWLIFSGTILMFSYLTLSYGFDWLLLLIYSLEALTWGVVIWYSYFPRRSL